LGYRISKEHAHEGCRVQWKPERLSYNSLAFISRSFDQLYSQLVGVLYEVQNTCAMAKKSSG
ncbi:unnamed protein product, partial [Brassica rapa subsp. trilocularis]